MKVRDQIKTQESLLSELRRGLHRIPETGFAIPKTHEFVMQYLQELQPDVLATIGDMGIKAVFYAPNATKTVAVRADMDALPVCECNEVPYKSLHEGYMHACGHDAHMAMALVCAKMVSEMVQRKKNVVFLFQPAEETTGGARPMIEAGALKDPVVDEIYGLHISPYFPKGVVACKSGTLMASVNDVDITIKGRGSHGALPQDGIDALVAAASFVLNAQTIVSRNVDPTLMGVLSIGKIEGGSARNVVCDRVSLKATIRSYEESVSDLILQRMQEMLRGLELQYGVQCWMNRVSGYPPVVNDAALTEAARARFTATEWVQAQAMSIAEDFSFYQKATGGVFAFLGCLDEQHQEPLHSGRFSFDEAVMMNGVEYFLRVIDCA